MQPLAARDDGDLPRADRQRGPDRAGRPETRAGRRPDLPLRLRAALRAHRLAPAAASAARGARRHPRVGRRERSSARRDARARRGRRRVNCTMPHRDRHRLGRPDRLRVGRATSSSRASTSSASRTTCARSFFGPEASTAHVTERAGRRAIREFRAIELDIRDARGASSASSPSTPREIELVIHTAAQPSHDWAARDPQTDFAVNANGTLNLLEATREPLPRGDRSSSCSTNKVYGDTPELAAARASSSSGWSCPRTTATTAGIDTTMSIDRSHALAVRRLQGRRRPAGAGVRPLLRHADRLLPRRLPDRAPATPARSCTASSPT